MKKFYALIASLFITLSSDCFAANNPSAIPHVPTISSMKALGSASSQYTNIEVTNYAELGDGGGGYFEWNPTSTDTVDPCVVFAANGVSTGRWVRVMNGTPFNVDMCGASGATDSSAAFTAAFKYCHDARITLYLSGKQYFFRHSPTYQSCNYYGQGSQNTFLNFTNDTDGGIGLNMTTSADGTWPQGPSFGKFSIIGSSDGIPGNSHITTGLEIANYNHVTMDDVNVETINGSCIHVGSLLISVFNSPQVSQCGSAGKSELRISGGVDSGSESFGVGLVINNINAGFDSHTAEDCPVSVDRWQSIQFIGGTIENAGTFALMCIGVEENSSVQGVSNLVVDGVDIEAPSSSGTVYYVALGTSWAGTANLGISNPVFINNTFVAAQSNVTSMMLIENTNHFYASNNVFDYTANPAVIFDFAGTGNVAGSLGVNYLYSPHVADEYVVINGVSIPSASDTPFDFTKIPSTVAGLPGGGSGVCTVNLTGQNRTVIDATVTLTAGIGTTVVGSGTNTVPVGCDGTHWKIGG